MTTPITAFTDTDRVRAALGVDAVDVSDEVLEDMQLELELALDLKGWFPGYATAAGDTLAALQLYAAAFCALSAIDGRELLYPYLFKDGKAETRRFALDFDKLKASLAARIAKWKAAIVTLEDLTLPAVTTTNYLFGSSAPATDIVTSATEA